MRREYYRVEAVLSVHSQHQFLAQDALVIVSELALVPASAQLVAAVADEPALVLACSRADAELLPLLSEPVVAADTVASGC